MTYDPSHWYWTVADSTTQAWSSENARYVPVSDPEYVAWLAIQKRETGSRIASENELQEVLSAQYPAGWPASPVVKAAELLAGGLTIQSTSTPALDGVYACDSSSVAHVSAEMISILSGDVFADGGTSATWADTTGGLHVFPSTALFKSFALAVAAFVAAIGKVSIGASETLPVTTATIT